jgi:hypothetical protein
MYQYFQAGPDALVRRWADAGNKHIHLDNPDTLFSEYIAGICSAKWGPDHKATTQWHLYSEPENLFPLPNVWLGVSVENQQAADERIPLLLETPAAVRFLSCEPLLGPVSLEKWMPIYKEAETLKEYANGIFQYERPGVPGWHRFSAKSKIDWVIAGGESGPGARPMHPDWARGLRDQCQAAGVPFFFKQWGEWAPLSQNDGIWATDSKSCVRFSVDGKKEEGGWPLQRVGKKTAGRLLDGQTWDGMPEVANG